MIKANKGTVALEGSDSLLLAELSTVTKAFIEVFTKNHGEEAAKEIVMHAVEIAFLSDEELDAEAEKANKLHEVLNEFGEKLAKIFAEGMGE